MSAVETSKAREIVGKPEQYFEDYQLTIDRVGKSGAIYHEKPVPFLYMPKIFTKQDIHNFDRAVKNIFSIANRTIDLYMKEAGVRALFGFDSRLEELILGAANGHGYQANVPMGRFDLFYYPGGGYKLCELNADGASAMNEEHELTNILLGTLAMQEIARDYSVKRFELFDSWVEEVKNIYNEYLASTDQAPAPFKNNQANYADITVAILDFIDKGNLLEFEVFKEHFQKSGFHCVIVDPRDLTYDKGKLFYRDRRIDIIYRRLVTRDLMDRYEEVPELIQGILANQTCIIGPIKSQVIHTKRFFEVLYQPAFRAFLSEDEIAYIDEHVPATKPLQDCEDLNTYICAKNQYIVKPVDGYASQGVCAGKDYSQEAWEALLKEKIREDYIIQEYCPLPLSENLLYDDEGKATLYEFHNLTGLFVYNQKFSGIYSRAGLNAIISGQHGGYTMSSVYLED
jgi:glutathionylspermidine synthase